MDINGKVIISPWTILDRFITQVTSLNKKNCSVRMIKHKALFCSLMIVIWIAEGEVEELLYQCRKR